MSIKKNNCDPRECGDLEDACSDILYLVDNYRIGDKLDIKILHNAPVIKYVNGEGYISHSFNMHRPNVANAVSKAFEHFYDTLENLVEVIAARDRTIANLKGEIERLKSSNNSPTSSPAPAPNSYAKVLAVNAPETKTDKVQSQKCTHAPAATEEILCDPRLVVKRSCYAAKEDDEGTWRCVNDSSYGHKLCAWHNRVAKSGKPVAMFVTGPEDMFVTNPEDLVVSYTEKVPKLQLNLLKKDVSRSPRRLTPTASPRRSTPTASPRLTKSPNATHSPRPAKVENTSSERWCDTETPRENAIESAETSSNEGLVKKSKEKTKKKRGAKKHDSKNGKK
jgi:hypothetical protein